MRDLLQECGLAAHIRTRGEEAKALKVEAVGLRPPLRRRTSALVDEPLAPTSDPALDKKSETYRAFLHFACGLLAFRAAGLFG
jgi:putative transposase